MVPFIVTLGTMLLVRGAAKGLADERRIEAPHHLAEQSAAHGAGRQRAACCPGASGSRSLLALVVAVTLQYTRFGRHLFADRIERAHGAAVRRARRPLQGGCLHHRRRAGRPRRRDGVLAGCRSAIPTVAVGLELDVIAAVIIGGGSLTGGKGSVVGTLAGAAHHDRHSDRLLPAGPAELGAADRHGHDHRLCAVALDRAACDAPT